MANLIAFNVVACVMLYGAFVMGEHIERERRRKRDIVNHAAAMRIKASEMRRTDLDNVLLILRSVPGFSIDQRETDMGSTTLKIQRRGQRAYIIMEFAKNGMLLTVEPCT